MIPAILASLGPSRTDASGSDLLARLDHWNDGARSTLGVEL